MAGKASEQSTEQSLWREEWGFGEAEISKLRRRKKKTRWMESEERRGEEEEEKRREENNGGEVDEGTNRNAMDKGNIYAN
jgi:hypothetical protein|uniref:Uncharacterized protein n=1 Tax=Oryza sativa subsp. japonica TaxID=39947 RepID=Q5VRK2_ORYSJ|nr:hypothetical protein [Oryza sativa Japonica Group]BAD67923.1 hypothetical protein [Oryza sativa Japonica Group]